MIFFQPISYGVVLLVFGLISLGPGTQSLGLEHLSVDNKINVTYLEEAWSETERLDDGDNGEDAHVMPQIRIHLKQSRVASLHHPPPPPAFFHALTSIHSRTHFLIVSHITLQIVVKQEAKLSLR